MQKTVGATTILALGSTLIATALCVSTPLQAKIIHHAHTHLAASVGGSRHRELAESSHHSSGRTLVHLASLHRNAKYAFLKGSKYRRYGSHYAGLQCVPFARAASGIELKGNAANWWDAAAGIYQRGASPESGSVLNFRANGHMRLGHVAVVTEVMDSRDITIEHANWAGPGANKGGVARNIPVEDVSPENDWSEVRVGLGRSGGWGSVYPTYGFIYDRPDTGAMLANRAPDGAAETASTGLYTEVAQAPIAGRTGGGRKLILDAPSRDLQ